MIKNIKIGNSTSNVDYDDNTQTHITDAKEICTHCHSPRIEEIEKEGIKYLIAHDYHTDRAVSAWTSIESNVKLHFIKFETEKDFIDFMNS